MSDHQKMQAQDGCVRPLPVMFERCFQRLAVLCLIWPCVSAILSAKTYVVATYGEDSNPGTWEQPFRHLSKGAAAAVAGDTVMVRDGTYGNESVIAPRYVVTLYRSGTASQPITFLAEHLRGAVLDAGNTVTNAGPCNGGAAYFDVANASYIVIQGFVITRGCDDGIHNNAKAHHIVIRQNEIHHIANRVITDTLGRMATGCAPTGHDITIDGNIIHDIGRMNARSVNSLDHGLYTGCSNERITNNIFYNQTAGWDIQLAAGADNVFIAKNTFASQNPKKSGQIMVWNSHTNLKIEHNVFFNAPNYAVTSYTEQVTNCEISYNIISGSAAVYSGTGCRIGFNQLHTDPMFVDPSTHNYQLLPDSPAAGSGIRTSAIVQEPTDNRTAAVRGRITNAASEAQRWFVWPFRYFLSI